MHALLDRLTDFDGPGDRGRETPPLGNLVHHGPDTPLANDPKLLNVECAIRGQVRVTSGTDGQQRRFVFSPNVRKRRGMMPLSAEA